MPRLAVSSSCEEWANKGKELFERKRYFQAKHCYERASMPRETAIANAYYLRGEARKIPKGNSRHLKEQLHRGFVTAAEAFLDCAQGASKNRAVYIRCAAECLELAPEDLRAAEKYLEAQEYNAAARLFRKLGHFDEAVDIVKNHKKDMQTDIVQNIEEVARLYYFREENFEKARELFSTDEEELEYLEDLDLGHVRAQVLVSLSRSVEAAAVYLAEGRIQEAIPLFLQNGQDMYSMHQACSCILQGFWNNVSYGIVPEKSQILQLIDWSNRLNLDLIDSKSLSEVSMFKAIVAHDKVNLAKLARVFLGTNNKPAATLCLYHCFRIFPQITALNSEELAEILHLFLDYIRLLYELTAQLYQARAEVLSGRILSLFGIHHVASDNFSISPGTFLDHTRGQEVPPEGLPIFGQDLSRILSQALRDEIRTLISQQIDKCKHAAQFFPCLNFNAFGYCNRISCPQEHILSTYVSKKWYNMRVRLNLQQVLILNTFYSLGVNPAEEMNKMNKKKRICLSQLYESFNPTFFYLGTQTMLDPAEIPEFKKGIQVVKEWLREVAYSLDVYPEVHFLTNMFRISNLALTFDPRDALRYLHSSPYLLPVFAIPPYIRAPNACMLGELLASIDGSKESSICAGFLSLCHIIDRGLPMNVDDICTLIEHLCTACVISSTKYRKGSLHGTTLPRSWLLHYLNRQGPQVKPRPPFSYLMPRIATLLETIYSGTGAEYLLFGSSNIAAIRSSGTRGVFITRICRAICLLGYNIPGPGYSLRLNIHRAVTSIYRRDRTFIQLYRQYVFARGWTDLVRALRNMPQGSLVDELIQLHDLGREAGPARPVHGVRIIPFRADDDLFQLLGASPPSLLETVSADSDIQQQQQKACNDGQAEDLTEHSVNVVEPDELDGMRDPDEAAELGDNFGDEPSSPAIIAADLPQAQPPSDEEKHAALTILNLYRRSRLQRGRGTKVRRIPSITKMISACWGVSHKMSWDNNRRYRFIFLWPLPHLLVCLDVALSTTSSQKKHLKKRLLEDHYENLDGLTNRMNEQVKLTKSLTRLQKTLEPASDLHRRYDIAELRRTVRETVQVLKALPFPAPDELQRNLGIAVKGILTPRQPLKSLPKPDLVWEDDIETVS
ncbi:hypothetical protein C0993_002573, partial [Termitomyces sp. T159_Od127]